VHDGARCPPRPHVNCGAQLIRREPDSEALVDWIDTRADTTLVASALVEVELVRALRRTEPSRVSAVPAGLDYVGRYEIDELVRTTAAGFASPDLRSPDASTWPPRLCSVTYGPPSSLMTGAYAVPQKRSACSLPTPGAVPM
jgi:hypothetical protein